MAYMGDYAHEAVDISDLATADVNSIRDLLEVLQMAKWVTKFQNEQIDLPTLFYIQDEHLIELGLALSERIKLLRCIQLLKDLPPPPASMAQKWQTAARPAPKVRFEEKVEEVTAEEKTEEEESNAVGEEALVDEAKTAASEERSHSMVFIRSDPSGQSEKLCTLLSAAFEDDLKAKSVAFTSTDKPDEVLACLETYLEESTLADDVLWLVFAGDGTATEVMPGLTFEALTNKVEELYRGRRVMIVLDTLCEPELSESGAESKANPDMQIGLLFSVYPTVPNPCFLTLFLLDTLRGRVPAGTTETYTLEKFGADAEATIEFVARCADVDVPCNFVCTPDFHADDLRAVDISKAESLITESDLLGMRGIYADRPIQTINVNGPKRVQVRYLDDDADIEWVNTDEVQWDRDEEEGDDSGGGGGRPLPVPPIEETQVEHAQLDEAVEEPQLEEATLEEADHVLEEETPLVEEAPVEEAPVEIEEHPVADESHMVEETPMEEEVQHHEVEIAHTEEETPVDEMQHHEVEEIPVEEEIQHQMVEESPVEDEVHHHEIEEQHVDETLEEAPVEATHEVVAEDSHPTDLHLDEDVMTSTYSSENEPALTGVPSPRMHSLEEIHELEEPPIEEFDMMNTDEPEIEMLQEEILLDDDHLDHHHSGDHKPAPLEHADTSLL